MHTLSHQQRIYGLAGAATLFAGALLAIFDFSISALIVAVTLGTIGFFVGTSIAS